MSARDHLTPVHALAGADPDPVIHVPTISVIDLVRAAGQLPPDPPVLSAAAATTLEYPTPSTTAPYPGDTGAPDTPDTSDTPDTTPPEAA